MLMPVRPLPAPTRSAVDVSPCAACAVRPRALFRVLPAASLAQPGPAIQLQAFAAGERLLGLGVPGSSLYTVREGIVRFERVTEQGERRIVRLAGPGALIGQEALLHRPYADDVVACVPVRACRIPRSEIEELAGHEPGLLRELMQRWQAALDDASAWTTDLNSGPARRRVLRLLQQLEQLAGPGEPAWLPMREEIGVMLGMAQETASRAISRLRREGVLQPAGAGRARIDGERLRQALCADADA